MVRPWDGSAEDSHDLVAHELVNAGVMLQEDVCGALEKLVHHAHELRRAPLLGQIRKPPDVGEEDCHLAGLPLSKGREFISPVAYVGVLTEGLDIPERALPPAAQTRERHTAQLAVAREQ